MVTTDDAAPALIEPVLAPGAVVAERYRIEARLGAGGGGTVFRCVDQQLGQTVALKIVASDGDLERWRREVAMARQITDRNVCRVHDLGETPELRYVTMELIEGESLRSKIKPGLPAAEARALIEQLISGVAAIHRAGVVHRDLKPENVVVTPDGRAVIVDFGIAKTPRRAATTRSMKVPIANTDDVATHVDARSDARTGATITQAGFAVGTPRYMSPEQANAEPVDARTDVWALGLVAHELLIGAMPILDVDGPFVASVVDERWPKFASVLRRCLTLDAKDRFADATALQAALPGKPTRSRWPLIVAGVGALVVASLVVVKLATRGDSAPGPEVPGVDPAPKALQLTTTLAKQWPAQTPISVALDPTGTQFAYTTGGGGVYVRPVAGGAAVEWKPPTVTRFDRPQPLIAPRVIGWFSDGALAITGATPSAFHLVRLRADGSAESLHQDITRFHAAIAKDEIVIADRSLHDLGGRVLVELTGRVVALARSIDGKLAWLRVAGGELILELAAGNQPIELWRGRSQLLIDPLLAFSGPRIVFSFRTDHTTIASIDPMTKQLTVIEETPAHVGTGSAVGGVALMIRGTARELVQIRDRYGTRTGLAHLPTERGDHLAGWTTTGAVVLRVDGRIVAGSAADDARKSWRVEPWPGTAKDDLPVATLGDDLIVQQPDSDAWLVDQITAAGTRTRLGRFPHTTALHCLPSGCVIQQHDGDDALWTELDPSGALGKPIHRRRVAGPSDFALSPDGAFLAIAAQGDVIAIDRATGLAVASPPAAPLATRWSTVGFDAEGDLWATAETLEVQPFGIVRFRHRSGVFQKPSSLATEKADILRHFAAPAIRRDGEGRAGGQADTSQVRIAVATQELGLEIWRTDGLPAR